MHRTDMLTERQVYVIFFNGSFCIQLQDYRWILLRLSPRLSAAIHVSVAFHRQLLLTFARIIASSRRYLDLHCTQIIPSRRRASHDVTSGHVTGSNVTRMTTTNVRGSRYIAVGRRSSAPRADSLVRMSAHALLQYWCCCCCCCDSR